MAYTLTATKVSWISLIQSQSKPSTCPTDLSTGLPGASPLLGLSWLAFVDTEVCPQVYPLILPFWLMFSSYWSYDKSKWFPLKDCFRLLGFINRFLSWEVFIPLGRTTYCFYLIHKNYLAFYYGHERKPGYYTEYDTIHAYLGQLLTISLLAFFVSLTVEAPFLNLEKLIFTPLTTKKDFASNKVLASTPTVGPKSD